MKLTELIKRGHLKKALEILEENANGLGDAEVSKNIVILKSRLTRHQNRRINKTEAHNTLEIEFNQLSENIYDLTLEFESQYGIINIENPKIENDNAIIDNNEGDEELKKTRSFFGYGEVFATFFATIVVIIFIFLMLNLIFRSGINYSNKPHNAILDTIKHIPQIGFDKSDKQLHIVIDILDQKFTWQKNEITIGQYVYDGRIIDLRAYFKDQLYLDKINESVEIICIGNASFEENLTIPVERRKREEETRASVRASNLRDILKSLLKNPVTPVYILNLGKYKFEKPPSSNMQRSIVMIRILYKEEGVNVNQALYNALTNSLEMPFKITNFSLIKRDSVELNIQ